MVPTVHVYVLPTGYLELPDTLIFAGGDPKLKHTSPDYSFLICHPAGKKVLFDLGLRKDWENYPALIVKSLSMIEPFVPEDIVGLLSHGDVKAEDIDMVILSHLHFDHTGDVTRFPHAEILVGPGGKDAASPGYPFDKGSSFDSAVLQHPRFSEIQYEVLTAKDSLPEGCPFDKGFDVFGDGSLIVVDAPGHMPGHQMAIARTHDQEWVVMGGDCCHHRDLLEDPRKDISLTPGPGLPTGFHSEPQVARRTIGKTRELHEMPEVLVVLAHDAKLEGVLPVYPEEVNGWRAKGLKTRVRQDLLTMEEVKNTYWPTLNAQFQGAADGTGTSV
ncbi:hypothetical protein ASPBRDRAFT_138723 [Aspergillus brasiliensis CBS 101740]|uniref:Metallo-beta-lactamase domain-containing protein n=1 Tax=Aspergillus brasiliensis (strain CBS 101740 / IMI 381727 / IBT 21946) TaxID=767769 RepID=A0A1L9U3G3_ASPBC|nr:hypothetical protein ASPBRDRAFT_138723 [Aspergillus brasiliensis CBS 101740]